MKARIEELKKMSERDLCNYACKTFTPCINNYGATQYGWILEVVSARMWEKAVKECADTGLLRQVLVIFSEYGFTANIDHWLAFDATPTEKLICAIAALEAKGE